MASFDVQRMSLYNLGRAEDTVRRLESKPIWQPADTASFDCMHYLGDSAIEHCAKVLHIQPGQLVLDIGSGFNATGRYLNRAYGVRCLGVELQSQIYALGQEITARTGQEAMVQSVNTDFITADQATIPDNSIDHIVSFLCILHIPDRQSLFARAAGALKIGGQLYVEDYYARQPLTEQDKKELNDVVSCPFLPTKEAYTTDLANAGFIDIKVEDMSLQWTSYVVDRAETYHQRADREADLDIFYSTVAALFKRGNLGGLRLHARHPGDAQ